jgi:hypothetical protein
MPRHKPFHDGELHLVELQLTGRGTPTSAPGVMSIFGMTGGGGSVTLRIL